VLAQKALDSSSTETVRQENSKLRGSFFNLFKESPSLAGWNAFLFQMPAGGTYSSFCVHNSTNNKENYYSRAVVHEAELPSCKGEVVSKS
jgi:hypothetical protein